MYLQVLVVRHVQVCICCDVRHLVTCTYKLLWCETCTHTCDLRHVPVFVLMRGMYVYLLWFIWHVPVPVVMWDMSIPVFVVIWDMYLHLLWMWWEACTCIWCETIYIYIYTCTCDVRHVPASAVPVFVVMWDMYLYLWWEACTCICCETCTCIVMRGCTCICCDERHVPVFVMMRVALFFCRVKKGRCESCGRVLHTWGGAWRQCH